MPSALVYPVLLYALVPGEPDMSMAYFKTQKECVDKGWENRIKVHRVLDADACCRKPIVVWRNKKKVTIRNKKPCMDMATVEWIAGNVTQITFSVESRQVARIE